MALAGASPWWTNGGPVDWSPVLLLVPSGHSPEMAMQKKVFWLFLQRLWVKNHEFFAIVTGWCIGFIKMRGITGQASFYHSVVMSYQNTVCNVPLFPVFLFGASPYEWQLILLDISEVTKQSPKLPLLLFCWWTDRGNLSRFHASLTVLGWLCQC